MPAAVSRVIVLLVVVLTMSVGLLSGCNDKSVDPPDDPDTLDPVVKDYPVYFCQPDLDERIYVFHPTSREIDSTDIPWRPVRGITVSADGKRLYLAQWASVIVVDTDSLGFIAELPYAPKTPVAVSPDNQLVAITGNDLHILRTSDYSLIFSDTDRTVYGRFSADSRRFYCAAGWSPDKAGFVYKVDLSDSLLPVTRKAFQNRGVTQVIPSPDESRWFMYQSLPGNWAFAFEVYDVASDSIIFHDALVPGAGHMTMSPNGRYVFYTNPGLSAVDPLPVVQFTVYDVEANELSQVITDKSFFVDSVSYKPPNTLTVTPDSRWLVALGGSMALSVLYVYDIEGGEFVYREAYHYPAHWLIGPTVQVFE
ncbi:hypothetical protein GF377_10410 [candidate division GN15 bacterium]|nr:hypothetical protein [candidate division GN15 bacterium]